MDIKQEKKGNLNTLVKINIEPSDYKEKVDKAIKSHSKKARIPGFRPGRVPASHIKKLYGKSILLEELNQLLSDTLNNYITENNLSILGQPLPRTDEEPRYNWDFEDTFGFTYELGLAPEFEIKISEKDKFTQYQVKADEKSIDERIKNLRRSYGKMTNPEESAEGDVIYGEFQQLTPEGAVFEEGVKATGSLRLELVEDKKILASLTGLKKDDELEIDLHKAFKTDAAHKIHHLLNIDEETAAALTSPFRLTVKNINRLEEAELNAEFFERAFPGTGVENEEQMRKQVAGEIESNMTGYASQRLQRDIYEKMIEKSKIDLPDDFLKRWLKTSNEQTSEEQIEQEYPDFAKSLRVTLIENKLLKENNIEIGSEEIIETAKQRIAAQFSMYSPTPLPDEQLNQYVMSTLQDKDQANRMYEEVRSRRVFEHLKSVVKLQEKEIGYQEFLDLK